MDRRLRFVLVMLLTLTLGLPQAARAQAAPGPFVKQAYDLLIDRFIRPPNSTVLLEGGWAAGVAFLKEAMGDEPQASHPGFTGDREADWRAFLAAYPKLLDVGGGTIDQHALDLAIARGMAKALNSSHTLILDGPPPGQSYGGIGIQISRELIVTGVFEGSPAEAAGLRRGDQVLTVNDVPISGMPSSEVSTMVRGPVGSAVMLTARRHNEPEPIEFSVTRAEIVVAWINARVLDGGVGYLQLRTTPEGEVLGPFDEAISRFESAGIKALVIDLRSNPGGSITTPVKVVSRFVRQGPVVQCTNRQGQTRTFSVDGSAWGRDVPMVVLVDGATSSGAEVVASGLQENGGFLVGTKTAGALESSQRIPLDDGSTLVVAVQDCRSGKGREIEHNGLDPDLAIDLDPASLVREQDNQLEATLEYLRTKMGG